MTAAVSEGMTHREARPGMVKQRQKIHWAARLSSARLSKAFNDRFPVGVPVKYNGVLTKTEVKAASNQLWEPAVFLEGVECPVPLMLLEIPEYVLKRYPG